MLLTTSLRKPTLLSLSPSLSYRWGAHVPDSTSSTFRSPLPRALFRPRLPVVIISRRTAGMTGTFHSICKHAGPVCPSPPSSPALPSPILSLESKGNAFCGRFPQCAILKQRKLQFQLKCRCVSECGSQYVCVSVCTQSCVCVCL